MVKKVSKEKVKSSSSSKSSKSSSKTSSASSASSAKTPKSNVNRSSASHLIAFLKKTNKPLNNDIHLKKMPVFIDSSMSFDNGNNIIHLASYRNAETESLVAVQNDDYDTFYNEQVIKHHLLSLQEPIVKELNALRHSLNHHVTNAQIEKMQELQDDISRHSYISYEITPLTLTESQRKETAKQVAKTKEVAKKQKKEIKEKVVKNMLQSYPFNLFNFKTRDECKSSARSKAYYINKSDMLDIIDKDENLVKAFPKGYKKLSKGEICDVFFDTKKW